MTNMILLATNLMGSILLTNNPSATAAEPHTVWDIEVATEVVCTTNDVQRYEPMEMSDGAYSWLMYNDNAVVPVFFVKTPIHLNNQPYPKERVRIITRKKVTTLTFDWNGKPRKIVDEEIVEEKRIILIHKEEWVVPPTGDNPKEQQ